MDAVVVAKMVDASLGDGNGWLNGANYLLAGNMLIYDLRARGSWGATTSSLATDIFADSLDSWSLTTIYSVVLNPGLTRLYASLGAGGI
jgi:hypothetical protein